MKKILNYISNGQGLGIKYLLLFSLILAIFYSVTIKITGDEVFVPTAQKIADEFLPVRIENGTIVEPADTVKTYSVVLGSKDEPDSESFNIVMDTTVDNLNTANLAQGIYITRRALYTINNNQTRIYNFEDSLYLPKDDYTNFFKTTLNWGVVFIGIFGFLGLFIVYFIGTIFYATCSYLISLILQKNFNFDLRMRLNTIAFITTYIVFAVLGWFGFKSFLVFFLAMLALQAVIFREIPSQEPNKDEKAQA